MPTAWWRPLGKLPVEALAVYTGEHAVEVLRNQRIDVVVTDLKLEGQVDGLDVLRRSTAAAAIRRRLS